MTVARKKVKPTKYYSPRKAQMYLFLELPISCLSMCKIECTECVAVSWIATLHLLGKSENISSGL